MERIIDHAKVWDQMANEGARSGDFDNQEGIILSKCIEFARSSGQTPEQVLADVQQQSGVDLSDMGWGLDEFDELAEMLGWT